MREQEDNLMTSKIYIASVILLYAWLTYQDYKQSARYKTVRNMVNGRMIRNKIYI